MTTVGKLRWLLKRVSLEALRVLPDPLAIRIDYCRVFGRFPKLSAPRLFSEKMQHIKLHIRHPLMPALVDKVRVKEFVRQKLGEDWLIPTLWHGAFVTEEILGDVPKPAVIKANHSSAQVCYLDENSDMQQVARTANAWLKYDHHLLHREWAYGKVIREILIEPFIGETEWPDDYKFWVLDGVVRFVQIDRGRFESHTRQFYTPDWKRLDFTLKYPASSENIPAPPHLAEMLNAARILAADFRFLRVDLYDTARRPLFGELTFAPEAGLCRFSPARVDNELGDSWSYPASVKHQRCLKAGAAAPEPG
jgi:hypothetical protein